MAHEAFGILAENMSPISGELAGYLVANFLVFAIEALAVGIQAMRLLYYEFSTKFFRGEGLEFKPLFTR
jgi:V/A-type H+-transporting ATPase subunit I